MTDLVSMFTNAIRIHPLMQHVADAGALGPMPTNMMRQPSHVPSQEFYGQRYMSPEQKSTGFYGEIGRGESPVTEYSVGGGGGQPLYPSVFKGMSGKQLQSVLAEANGGPRFPQSIENQAFNAAQDRMSQGLSPFWNRQQDGPWSR